MQRRGAKPVLNWHIPKGFKGEIDADKMQLASVFGQFYEEELKRILDRAELNLRFAIEYPENNISLVELERARETLFALSILQLDDLRARKLLDKANKAWERHVKKIRKQTKESIRKGAAEWKKKNLKKSSGSSPSKSIP